MKRWISSLVLFLFAACASMPPLQKAQLSHDSLALAQDTEAQLCYGMTLTQAMATPAMAAAPNHCPAPASVQLGWTDARHQDFNRWLKQALDAQATFTRILASGGTADATSLNAAVGTILFILANLPQTNPTIQMLTLQVSKARIQ